MNIRKYTQSDCKEMAKLFYDTVHTINAKDYTKDKLDVWATGDIDLKNWHSSFAKNNTLVAVEKGEIVGFGDMDSIGYLDRLYTHKDYQNRGIATAIIKNLELEASEDGVLCFTTHASITAKTFFEKNGYMAVSQNEVVRSGITLINFIMKKHI